MASLKSRMLMGLRWSGRRADEPSVEAEDSAIVVNVMQTRPLSKSWRVPNILWLYELFNRDDDELK